MKFKSWLILGLCVFWINANCAKEFNYTTYQLENGLQVILIPNNRAPVAYHSIWYKVGSADSPTHQSGLAHFLEHLMFKGTQRFPKDSFKRIINDLGGEQNANTSWDRTVYFVTIAKEHLTRVMEMEADRMQNLLLNEDDINKEKDVVLQERRSTVDTYPENCLFEAANASFFWEHPYGKPIIGFEEHIRKYTKANILKFYNDWYVPNNAILVIAGDIDINTLKPLIHQYYGKLKSKPIPTRQRALEPDHRGTTAKVEIRDPKVTGTFFQRIYPAPNFRTGGSHLEATLTLLQDILGDSTYGRLTQTLVENQKLAQFVAVHYTGYYSDPYSFTLSGSPLNNADLSLLETSVEAELRRLISDGVTGEELAIAKQQWTFEALYRQDSLYGIANYFGENLSVGYNLKDLENWLATLQSVTAEDIKIAAKSLLNAGPAVTLYAYPVAQK